MTRVGVRALKNELSRYLRLVSDGERIVVTERGRPIALLSGFEEARDANDAWALVDARVADWGGGKPKGSARPVRVGKSAADMVIEDRR